MVFIIFSHSITLKPQTNNPNPCQSHVTDKGEAVESPSALPRVISYIPYGEIFVEQQSGAWQSPYLFNSKELDSETGLYYYGARYLDPSEGMWLSVDPLFEKYVGMSPYGYCAGNPVRLVDKTGKYPEGLLDPINEKENIYHLKSGAVHLLALVSGVKENCINFTYIQKRKGFITPFYSSNKGGGAITLGTSSSNAAIILTQNFFEDDLNEYDKCGYGKRPMVWLDLLAHEVGHLPQIDDQGGYCSYIASFAWDYIKNLGHDNVPREQQADNGRINFEDFNDFINTNIKENGLFDLFKDDKLPQDFIIKKIDEWWGKYNDYKNNQLNHDE